MLRIDFSIAPDAQAALEESGRPNTATAVVPIVIEKEVLRLLAPPVSSSGGGLEDSLKAARKVLETKSATAAFLVARTTPSTQYVVVYVSDAASAKDRILYSTGTSRVVGATPQAHKRTIQISSASELTQSLFDADSKKVREDLMTESERQQASIARMELAPQPVALPGVAIKMAAEADDMLEQFARGAVDVVTFKIVEEQLQLDQTLRQLNGDLDLVKDVLPEADPRFVLLRCTSAKTQRAENIMVYVCPPTCSPKIKIHYASSAAAFREQASRHEIKFAHKVETDTAATLAEDVRSASVPFPSGGGARGVQDESRPRPPASSAPKGHRMLI
ncbi:twinfilin [Novymonas esmeraldas]|uniref:Twinfilin n=1 Tax=Novymonas esmeraldas TaxID=1808958 RepID=A0AAW0F6B4_9TRYP